jgi:hypothetical protein
MEVFHRPVLPQNGRGQRSREGKVECAKVVVEVSGHEVGADGYVGCDWLISETKRNRKMCHSEI